jgi:hypothetical protein
MTLDVVYVLPVSAGQPGKPTTRRDEAGGYLRFPRNSRSFEPHDDLQSQYSFFSKIHSPVPFRRPSLIRWWWLVYGAVDIHWRKSRLLIAAITGVSEASEILRVN